MDKKSNAWISYSRRSRRYRLLTAALLVLGVGLVVLSWTQRPPPRIEWLPAADAPPQLPEAQLPAPTVAPGAIPYANSEISRAFAAPAPAEGDPAATPPGITPGANLYALPGTWRNAAGQSLLLGALRGRPTIYTFAYTRCWDICPLVVEALQAALAYVPKATREQARQLLLSIDPKRDTPQAMATYLESLGLPPQHWQMLTAPQPLPKLAAAQVDFRFEPVGERFSHNAVIAVADEEGTLRGAWSEGITRPRWLGRQIAQALANP